MVVVDAGSPDARLPDIAVARRLALAEGQALPPALLGAQRGWIERSWRRCLQRGLQPQQRVAFDCVSRAALRASDERHHALLRAAAPLLDALARAVARAGYFAILTDAHGVVIDARGAIDHGDPRALAIARVGVDLSEARVGTSAVGVALHELHPVWLHRGEHFFGDTQAYSCARAPLIGPDGDCIGMIDLTGIDAAERCELVHLAAHTAQRIGNALVLERPHALLLRLNWPGDARGGDDDALLGIDADGCVCAANQAARALLPRLAAGPRPVHAGELFALAPQRLFEHARASELLDTGPMEVALWSGLVVQLRARRAGSDALAAPQASARNRMSLQQLEHALVLQSVDTARGNVAQAARALGVSRATVYRKLGARRARAAGAEAGDCAPRGGSSAASGTWHQQGRGGGGNLPDAVD